MQSNGESGGSRRRGVLLGVIVVVLLGGAVYQFTSQDEPSPEPYTRRTSDFLVNWRCLNCIHTTTQPAGRGPQLCPQCERQELYVSMRWACPEHGVFDVAFQYDEEGKPSEVKFPQQDWIAALNEYGGWNMACPKCGGGLNPAETPRTGPQDRSRAASRNAPGTRSGTARSPKRHRSGE